MKQPFDAEVLASWVSAKAGPSEVLNYPPPNPYVPKCVPTAMRKDRANDQPVSKPVLLSGGDSGKAVSDVWFKQDD